MSQLNLPDDPRPLMVELARLMYARHLTNSAGGNLSCRVGAHTFITPRYAGSKQRWNLQPAQLIVLDAQERVLEGDAALLSRESTLHFACLRAFPAVNGVIHAHPRHLSVFANAGRPLTPTVEYTHKFGVLDVVRPLPSHSAELADAVVAALRPRAATLQNNGLGLILAQHGVVVVARDMAEAYDVLDRLEDSAHTLLHSAALPAG